MINIYQCIFYDGKPRTINVLNFILLLCVQEVVHSIYIMSYYINWINYLLDTGYIVCQIKYKLPTYIATITKIKINFYRSKSYHFGVELVLFWFKQGRKVKSRIYISVKFWDHVQLRMCIHVLYDLYVLITYPLSKK